MNYKKMFFSFLMMGLPLAGFCSDNDLHGAWPVIGQNKENTGVARTDDINSRNVGSLTQSWTFYTANEFGVAATPTVSGGVVFIANGSGNVYALNEKTGSVIWKQTLVASDRGNAPQVFDTAPTITKSRVFVALDHIFALDKFTGAVLWDTPIYQPGQFLTDSAGNTMVAGNNVIIGVGFNNEDEFPPSGHYTGEYGRIMAFNQDTGAIAWSFPISNPSYGTGGTSFSMAGVDDKRQLIFIGTGNNYEPPGSPFEDSLLALNYETGELIWSYQFESNDIWSGVYYTHDGTHDADVGSHPNIFSLCANGTNYDLVGVGGKDGSYRIFTRDQANPTNVTPLVQIQLDPGGLIGGIQATPVINDGILYASSHAFVDPSGNRVSLDTLFTNGLANFQQDSFAAVFGGNSKIVAIDLAKLIQSGAGSGSGPVPPPTNTVLWTFTSQSLIISPSGLSFCNGVLFYTNALGTLNALDARNGSLIFSSPVFPVSGGGECDCFWRSKHRWQQSICTFRCIYTNTRWWSRCI